MGLTLLDVILHDRKGPLITVVFVHKLIQLKFWIREVYILITVVCSLFDMLPKSCNHFVRCRLVADK